MIPRRWTFSSMILEIVPTSPIGEPKRQASEGLTTLASRTMARMAALVYCSSQMTSNFCWFNVYYTEYQDTQLRITQF